MKRVLVLIRGWWEDLQDSLWLMPGVTVVAAIVVANLLVSLTPEAGWLPSILRFEAGPDGAREVLSQLAGATFTVVGVVFSLTAVALQMASSQFTPRLLRSFLKDRSVQLVLSGLVGSGVFHVAVLRHVRSGTDDGDAFVPELAVSVSLLAALVAVGLLIYFLHHLLRQLRVDTVMTTIRRETLRQLERLAVHRATLPDEPAPAPPDAAVTVVAQRSGYLQTVDLSALVAGAHRCDVVVRLRPVAGEWVGEDTTLAWVWSSDGGPPGVEHDELARLVHAGIFLGPDRTESGDLAFGIRQLEDIAGRALSTGVNDPTTAVQAIGQLAAILVRMAAHPLGTDVGTDGSGQVRATAPRPDFAAHLELAVGQVRGYGASEVAVLVAILQLLTDVAEQVADHADRAAAVRDQIDRTERATDLSDPVEVARVERAAETARRTLELGHRPPAGVDAG